MSFKIDFENFPESDITLTTKLVGHFSIDGNKKYQDDLSQLKYYIPPFNPNVHFDLNKNYESTILKSTSYVKLDNILRWISDNFNRLEKPLSVQDKRWLDIDFICSRGTIKTILSSPYIERTGWIICASKYRGTIYLCEFYTDEKEHDHVNATTSEKQISSLGFKFEQYMVADHPLHEPDTSVILNTREAFHCMFETNFDNHSVLYGAEIDGISSRQPFKITNTLIDKLDKFELIELKTFPMCNKDGNINGKISRERISMCWSQNYFPQINRTICGLKNKFNIVKKIREYSSYELPQLSAEPFDTNKCKIFCKIFLDNVKRIVTKDHNKCMYKFYWMPLAKNVVNYSEEAPNNEKYFFLKQWFVHKADECRRLPQ
ncbi:PREDICTED: decapping and exoribonuclease protein-like [Wasmannia auropunctata]|uniref:decapping and exoribonuclease protein-like n=1 Tax=Wasmannia auropunctata TaxID=64793 RepID=UPI0005EEC845|nr:PREDICTED: decapping and exoribonuclease protein-like [Wasmannia auropunctata]XP_011693169.1 PREDICTED: decapping and exoribonuclease protein-like [Wasmannia auropunctata]XP_011693170.1 PREDICTED: decapping and exoribonuclease protein-like [Wasmannia auropunctata]